MRRTTAARTTRVVEKVVERQLPTTPGIPPGFETFNATYQGALAESEWLAKAGGDPYGTMKKPRVQVSGQDGNIYFVMARCDRAARKANWPEEKRRAVMKRIQDTTSYDKALGVVMEEFDVR